MRYQTLHWGLKHAELNSVAHVNRPILECFSDHKVYFGSYIKLRGKHNRDLTFHKHKSYQPKEAKFLWILRDSSGDIHKHLFPFSTFLHRQAAGRFRLVLCFILLFDPDVLRCFCLIFSQRFCTLDIWQSLQRRAANESETCSICTTKPKDVVFLFI